MSTTFPGIAQSLPRPIPQDVPHIWTLPTPPGAALPLVMADFENAATELGVETAALRAVAQVEGGSTGFDAKGRPLLRYEPGYFRTHTHGQFDADYPDLSTTYGSDRYWVVHEYDYDQMWDALTRAFALAPEAAVMSCSWGMFQVLGEHALKLGWTDLETFVSDMFYSTSQHLRACVGFCRMKDIVGCLRDHDWAGFAVGYNGGDYGVNHYDTKLANAYAQFSQ